LRQIGKRNREKKGSANGETLIATKFLHYQLLSILQFARLFYREKRGIEEKGREGKNYSDRSRVCARATRMLIS